MLLTLGKLPRQNLYYSIMLTEFSVKRVYDFTISKTTVSADGYTKEALLINNQFPGPMIEANW
jgi:hypothetical protein